MTCCERTAVFSAKELCDQLGVGEKFPSWVVNLAAAGATVHDGILKGKEYADKAAIMAKAKAGEFDEKYNISGTAKAAAKGAILCECLILSRNLTMMKKDVKGRLGLPFGKKAYFQVLS